jgi:hypothetical protein
VYYSPLEQFEPIPYFFPFQLNFFFIFGTNVTLILIFLIFIYFFFNGSFWSIFNIINIKSIYIYTLNGLSIFKTSNFKYVNYLYKKFFFNSLNIIKVKSAKYSVKVLLINYLSAIVNKFNKYSIESNLNLFFNFINLINFFSIKIKK